MPNCLINLLFDKASSTSGPPLSVQGYTCAHILMLYAGREKGEKTWHVISSDFILIANLHLFAADHYSLRQILLKKQ